MRMSDMLLTPWRSTLPSVRGMVLALFGTACLAAVTAGVLMHGMPGWSVAEALYCFGVGYLWAFLLSGMLLIVLGGIVLPRLMAGQAIFAAAQAHAGQPSTGNTLQ